MNSITFLQQFHPTGYWVLTAIQVDRKGIETVTFTPDQADKAQQWLAKRNGKANLYFSVNQPTGPLKKKANREDIASVGWLHVDIDAQAGQPLDSELERIKQLVTGENPLPPATVVVYSGGGYQAFWRLTEPVELNGDMDVAERMAAYNKQLELVLGGDNCHNVDRIMRLPGTMNLPNAKKVERGRVPVEAEVYWFNPTAYTLDQFTPAPKLQSGVQTAQVSIKTSNVERLNSVDDLNAWHVDDRIKVVIVQGYHPDETKDGDNSRSAWLFDVCCQLVRKGVPDEVIYSVITDPNFGISTHVLQVEGNSDRYALRQIQRAKEEVEEPWLRELNDQFMVIGNLGGKCRVCEETYDVALKRSRLTKQSFQDFRNRYCNHSVTVGKKQMPVGIWWSSHPRRRQFSQLVFSPGRSEPDTYNLWQGFAHKSIPGDKHQSFLLHTFNNICAGSRPYYEYLLGWMARAVQYPDRPGETAVVLRGSSGVGKSFFAKRFGALWGRHFMQVSDAKHLVGSFNAHLRDCVVLFGDEAFFAGDRRHEATLKTLITEEQMIIEAKGVDAEVNPNFIHLILASNSQWVVPAGATERRFFVLDVSDNHRQDGDYFSRIYKDLCSGGYENLLHYLLNYNLAGYDVRKVPMTDALREQKIHSLDPMGQWWLTKLLDGAVLASHDTWQTEVNCIDLVEDYISSCVRFNVTRRGSEIKLGMFLNQVCPGNYPMRVRTGNGTNRRYVYRFPTLDMCRQRWDDNQGCPTKWPGVPEQAQLPLRVE